MDDNERRSFALKLKLDPTAAFCKVYFGPKEKTKTEKVTESSGVKSENKKGLKKGWWALWEVAKEEGLPWDPNNEILMKLLYSLVEGCTERPGPLPQQKSK